MNREGYEISLLDLHSGEKASAMLYQGVSKENIQEIEKSWKPLIVDALKRSEEMETRGHLPIGDAYWDWKTKIEKNKDSLAYAHFVIEQKESLQAIVQLETVMNRSSLESGKEIVYVDLLSVAPWNRPFVVEKPRFRRCGSFLMAQAIGMSLELGFEGRVSLHSLPSAAKWYRDLGMTSLGADAGYGNLEKFEFSTENAKSFLERGK